jgi:hypothetical protein
LVGWNEVPRYCGHFWPIVQKVALREIGLDGMDWIDLAQDRPEIDLGEGIILKWLLAR